MALWSHPKDTIKRWQYQLLGLLTQQWTVDTRQGRFCIKTNDKVISRDLFVKGQYEFDSSVKTLRFIRENNLLADHGPVRFLDVGANIGVISIGLLKAKEIDKAVCIEPAPENFALLQKNCRQNGMQKDMLCLQLAAAAEPGELPMALSKNNYGDHRILSLKKVSIPEVNTRKSIQVKALPLDEVIKNVEQANPDMNPPTIAWFDVQGYEGYAFKGGKKLLKSNVVTVAEIWPYGILQSGMTLIEFTEIVQDIWSVFWVEQDGGFLKHPISDFNTYLDRLGTEGDFQNIILT